MPRANHKSKTELTETLAAVFHDSGYDGASLSQLADASGLSKASLYHHFPGGKADIARHVLGRVGVKLQRDVIAPLHGDGNVKRRIMRSLDATADFYKGDRPGCLMNTLAMGEGGRLFKSDIAAGVQAWTDGLKSTLIDGGLDDEQAEEEAQMALAQIQGSLVLSRATGHRAPLELTLEQLKRRLVALL